MAEEQSTKRLPPKITNIKVERSIFWKIYYFIITSLIILGCVGWIGDENFGLAEIVSILMSLIGTIGLYGYVFSKRIYKQSFWLYFLVFYLIFGVAYFFITDIETFPEIPEISHSANNIMVMFGIVITIILSLPAYIGLLLYALPSNKLWKNID